MKELLLSLAEKCFDNDFDFDYSAESGIIYIWEVRNGKYDPVGVAYIKNWSHATPEEELANLHALVDEEIEQKEEVV